MTALVSSNWRSDIPDGCNYLPFSGSYQVFGLKGSLWCYFCSYWRKIMWNKLSHLLGFFFSFPAFTYPWVFLCPSSKSFILPSLSERRQLLMGAGLAFSESILKWLMPPGGKVEGTREEVSYLGSCQEEQGMVALKQGSNDSWNGIEETQLSRGRK